MSPERRTLIIEAMIAIFCEFNPNADRDVLKELFDRWTDAELTVKVANIEALIERAQQTDV